jgi:hypothetical protein
VPELGLGDVTGVESREDTGVESPDEAVVDMVMDLSAVRSLRDPEGIASRGDSKVFEACGVSSV